MAPRFLEGRELNHPEPKPTNPYACVCYGPLLMALPVPDADPNTPVARAKWNYALDIDATRQDHRIQAVNSAMPEKWQWQLDTPILSKLEYWAPGKHGILGHAWMESRYVHLWRND
jgi:hypothetical protein